MELPKRDKMIKATSYREKKSLTIIGESKVKQIRNQDINNECPSYKSYVKTFPGARVD